MDKDKLENVTYRKFDSDDVMRIRGNGVITSIIDDKKDVKVDTGKLQKVSIISGIKKCKWFKDDIKDNEGISEDVFNRRMSKEFRLIPIDIVDKLFKEIQEFNKADFDNEELKKVSH